MAAKKKSEVVEETKAEETKPATKEAGFVYLGNGVFNGYKRGDVIPAEFFKDKPNKQRHMLKTQQIKKA